MKLAESNWREQLSNWYSNTLSEEDRRTLQAGLVGAVGGGATLGLSAHRARRKDGSKRGVLGQIILGMLAGGASTASLAHLFSGQLSNVVDRFKAQPDEAPAPDTPTAEAGQRQVGTPRLADRVGDGQTALGADVQHALGATNQFAAQHGLYGAGVGASVGMIPRRGVPRAPWTDAGRVQGAIARVNAVEPSGDVAKAVRHIQDEYSHRFDEARIKTIPAEVKELKPLSSSHFKTNAEYQRYIKNFKKHLHVPEHQIDAPGIKKWNIPARLKEKRDHMARLKKLLNSPTYGRSFSRGAWRTAKAGVLPFLGGLGGSFLEKGLRDQFARQVGNTDFQLGK